MAIHIYDIRFHKDPPGAVRIDHQSILWNSSERHDRSPEEALVGFKKYFRGEMLRYGSPVRLELFRLSRLAKNGDLYLGCLHCPDIPTCHGQVIKATIEWILKNEISETEDLGKFFPPKKERLV
jgi:hypothetical protein